jgi:membrane associated rhomboid family serine protease
MTPWVLGLITVNGLVFLATMSGVVSLDTINSLALTPYLLPVRPWTAITYMFLHAGTAHIFFNMLGLYIFGPPVEARLGGRRFATLYFLSGIAGALLSLVTPYAPIVGASGAIYGTMLAFAWFWPRQPLMLWGILAIEARWLIVIFTLLSLWGARTGAGNTAHFAHLGGFVGAWLYLRWLGRRGQAATAAWQKKVTPPVSVGGGAVERWKRINAASLHPVNREEYERVIAKLDTQGTGALTAGEKEFLDRFSQVM